MAGLAGITAGCMGGDDDGGNGGDDDADTDGTDSGDPATFEVSNLEPSDVAVTIGDSVDVSATITNSGDESGTQTVALLLDGDVEADDDLDLDGGDDAAVSFTLETIDLDEGEYEYEIATDDDGASAALTVEQTDISTQFWSYNGANMSTVELIHLNLTVRTACQTRYYLITDSNPYPTSMIANYIPYPTPA